MKPLTILFDADDTAENLLECWLERLNLRYGTTVTMKDVTSWDVCEAFPGLSKDEVYSVLAEEDLWRNLEAWPRSLETLEKLRSEGHELYMVTASDYRTCKPKMERILELFPFLDWDHIIITSQKHMVRGDILIDDGPHNLVDFHGISILFDQPHNRSFDNTKYGILRAFGWDEVYELVGLYELYIGG